MFVFPQTFWLRIIISLRFSALFTLKNLFTLLLYFPATRIEHQQVQSGPLEKSEISAHST